MLNPTSLRRRGRAPRSWFHFLCVPVKLFRLLDQSGLAFVAARHAYMHLVSLSHSERRRGDRRFERRLLRGKFAIDVSVVQNAPLIADRDDRVLSQSHLQPPGL